MANYLDMSRYFAVLLTSPQQVCCVVVMEFGKRHDTTDTADFCPCQCAKGNWSLV